MLGDPGVSAPAGGCGCRLPRCGFHQLSSCPGDTRTGQTDRGHSAPLPPHVPPACPHHSLNSQLPPLPGSPSAGAAAPVCFWLLPSLTVIRRCVGLPVLVRPAEATRATRGARLSPFAAGFGWAGWQGMRGEGQRSLGRGTARRHPVPRTTGGSPGCCVGGCGCSRVCRWATSSGWVPATPTRGRPRGGEVLMAGWDGHPTLGSEGAGPVWPQHPRRRDTHCVSPPKHIRSLWLIGFIWWLGKAGAGGKVAPRSIFGGGSGAELAWA